MPGFVPRVPQNFSRLRRGRAASAAVRPNTTLLSMQTFASTADPAASHWPADGSRLDRLDKRLSGPLFQLQLSARLEVLLSVPGCFFGMPAALAVTPSLLAAAYSGGVPPSHLALGAGVLLLAAWGVVVIVESEAGDLALRSIRLILFHHTRIPVSIA